MGKIKYRTKKNRESSIVWLQKSNRCISFKNPAFGIFQMLARNTENKLIYSFLTGKYGLVSGFELGIGNYDGCHFKSI